MAAATKPRSKSTAPVDQQEDLNIEAPVEETTQPDAPGVDESPAIDDVVDVEAPSASEMILLQEQLDNALARIYELEQRTTVERGCNYSVGTVYECSVLTNANDEPWAVKMPVHFTVGVNKNVIDKSIPEDAEPDWIKAPIAPSGKTPYFIYKEEDFLELAEVINSSSYAVLGLQWRHSWSRKNELIQHPKTGDRKAWIGLKNPADNQIKQYAVLKSEPNSNDQEIPF